ncbi:dTMP kinase [Telmatospirillum sp.]|uniref:dTMP kinase n=1 Tax=Telmatospirillum sp. TaxID=2079197 RepID=UPI00283CC982|nr:dTMP kinase [Telmatospirillum sp.]MDR3439954.1 dTMP kinase [Telmatospirillum sp.]
MTSRNPDEAWFDSLGREDGLNEDIEGIRQFYSNVVTDLTGMLKSEGRTGKFVVLEGMEECGKAVLTGLVAETLCERGLEVILSREPGGAPGADAIRQLLSGAKGWEWGPATELLLHAAQRLDHLQNTIIPALAEGVWVVCDSFVGYSIAHLGHGQGLGRDAVFRLHQQTTGGFMPDLTVVLTAGKVREAGYFVRVAEGYLSLVEDSDVAAVLLPLSSKPRETADRIVALIDKHLGVDGPVGPQAIKRDC